MNYDIDESEGSSLQKKRKYIVFALIVTAVLVVGLVGAIVLNGHEEKEEKTVVAQPIVVLRTADYHSLSFSTNDSNVVFFGHHDGIMRSDDGGVTWNSTIYTPNFDVMSLAMDSSTERLMYAAGHLIFQGSRDGGSTWSPIQNNLPSTDIHGFAVSPAEPKRLFALVNKEGFFHSTDGGSNWELLSMQLPPDVMTIAVARGDPETLYAGSMRAGLFKSTNEGRNWELLNGPNSGGIMTIALNYQKPQTVYAGGMKGLHKSTDGGKSWQKLAFPGDNVVAVAVSPTQSERLLAISVAMGNGAVYRSEDGGRTWGK